MFDPEPQVVSFHPEMPEAALRAAVHPHTVEKIEDNKVFFTSNLVELAKVRACIMDWWQAWDDRQPKKPPFDYEKWLEANGFEPEPPKRRRDLSNVPGTQAWVEKNRRK